MKSRLALIRHRHAKRIGEVWRFYVVGVVNTIFGYGVYALLVFTGLNIYVAQIAAQITGMCFNYFTFTRHVFQGAKGSPVSFGGVYLLNYLINLTLLALFHRFTDSPYLAGLMATLCASFVNFVLLKFVVFRTAGKNV